MRIALAQLEPRLGDVDGNAARAREAIADAATAGASLVVFPELFLSGYAVAGAATRRGAATVAALAPGSTAALIGFHETGGYNSAVYAAGGRALQVQRKLHLVDYAPFDEGSVFRAGGELRAFDTPGGRLATLICNDAWQPLLPVLAVHDGARMLLMPSCSSTAVAEAREYWQELTRFYARMLQCYVVFVNRVGEEAGFSFWGGSHVIDPYGERIAAAGGDEALVVVDVDLAQVEGRRRELPLQGAPRLDLLRAQLDRLAHN